MDLCTAEVSTGYFMMTSVNSAPIASILAADGTNCPVIPFVPAESGYCSNFKMCINAMDEAKEFYPQMDRYFLADEVLYSENLRIKFCNELRSCQGYGPVDSLFCNAGRLLRTTWHIYMHQTPLGLPTFKATPSRRAPEGTFFLPM